MTVTPRVDGAKMGSATELARRILADRFEIIDDPLGWRCRSCGAEVSGATVSTSNPSGQVAVARLADAAADHALYCGRCND